MARALRAIDPQRFGSNVGHPTVRSRRDYLAAPTAIRAPGYD